MGGSGGGNNGEGNNGNNGISTNGTNGTNRRSDTAKLSASSSSNNGGGNGSAADENTKSTLSFFGSLVPSYFQGEWSFAQFRTNESHTLVAFGSEPNTIIIVGADGSFWKASYEGGGECVEQAYCKFVATDGETN